jgi:hypothetical protein
MRKLGDRIRNLASINPHLNQHQNRQNFAETSPTPAPSIEALQSLQYADRSQYNWNKSLRIQTGGGYEIVDGEIVESIPFRK